MAVTFLCKSTKCIDERCHTTWRNTCNLKCFTQSRGFRLLGSFENHRASSHDHIYP